MNQGIFYSITPSLTDSIVYTNGQAASGSTSSWILATNFWNDSGVWIDEATWND